MNLNSYVRNFDQLGLNKDIIRRLPFHLIFVMSIYIDAHICSQVFIARVELHVRESKELAEVFNRVLVTLAANN